MSPAGTCLDPRVRIEPRVHSWYAWVQAVAPAPAALHLADRQLRLMRSYVASPALHAAAVGHPELRGGQFLGVPVERVGEVAALLDATTPRIGPQLAFAQAVHALDEVLRAHPDGAPVQGLYHALPDALRGLVELYVDRWHRPGFRVLEPLLYTSEIYDEDAQSIALSIADPADTRPFVFSTPRLPSEAELSVSVPFRSEALDLLAAARRHPTHPEAIAEALGLDADGTAQLRGWFGPPPQAPDAPDAPVRVRYLGHACVLIEHGGSSVLLDPLIPYGCGEPSPRLSHADLPDRIDAVVITHGHHDHFVIESLLQLRHRVDRVLVPAAVPGGLEDTSLALMLRQLGFSSVEALHELQPVQIGAVQLIPVPFLGEHHDLHITSKLGYHLSVGDHRLLFMADACNVDPPLYERIRRHLGPIDALFVGMESKGAPLSWVYAPVMASPLAHGYDQLRRGRGCDRDEAWALVQALGCARVFVYAMGKEPWVQHLLDLHYTEDAKQLTDARALVERCHGAGVPATLLDGPGDVAL